MSNQAYAAMWGLDPSTSLSQINVSDATRHWSDHWAPSPVWGDIREFICGLGARSEWSETVLQGGGPALFCRIVPVSGGGTMITFSQSAPSQQTAAPSGFKSRRILA